MSACVYEPIYEKVGRNRHLTLVYAEKAFVEVLTRLERRRLALAQWFTFFKSYGIVFYIFGSG